MTKQPRPSQEKIKVARHRIPKANLFCSRCESGTSIRSASPFAEGYHRRHDCMNDACGFHFYSLASYHDTTVKVSPLPFKDRELSPLEVAERHRWLAEEASHREPVSVTSQVIAQADRFADPTVKRINDALLRAEALRSDTEQFIVSVFQSLKDELETMDGTHQEDTSAAQSSQVAPPVEGSDDPDEGSVQGGRHPVADPAGVPD